MTIGGAFGGIISGNIFREQDAPTYTPGILVCMCFQVSIVIRINRLGKLIQRAIDSHHFVGE